MVSFGEALVKVLGRESSLYILTNRVAQPSLLIGYTPEFIYIYIYILGNVYIYICDSYDIYIYIYCVSTYCVFTQPLQSPLADQVFRKQPLRHPQHGRGYPCDLRRLETAA